MKSSRVSELVAYGDAAIGDDKGDEDGGHDEVATDLGERGYQETEQRLGILQEVEQPFDQLLHLAEGVQAELDCLRNKDRDLFVYVVRQKSTVERKQTLSL